jgi:hypothetical protein
VRAAGGAGVALAGGILAGEEVEEATRRYATATRKAG